MPHLLLLTFLYSSLLLILNSCLDDFTSAATFYKLTSTKGNENFFTQSHWANPKSNSNFCDNNKTNLNHKVPSSLKINGKEVTLFHSSLNGAICIDPSSYSLRNNLIYKEQELQGSAGLYLGMIRYASVRFTDNRKALYFIALKEEEGQASAAPTTAVKVFEGVQKPSTEKTIETIIMGDEASKKAYREAQQKRAKIDGKEIVSQNGTYYKFNSFNQGKMLFTTTAAPPSLETQAITCNDINFKIGENSFPEYVKNINNASIFIFFKTESDVYCYATPYYTLKGTSLERSLDENGVIKREKAGEVNFGENQVIFIPANKN
ncbi:MAG: hypothetical protein HQK50_05720 [Oligoflexia bacterium]|nr:hypothetical protein [Oligoflexia bacterium]MBF0365048.1 hypothetical protein [Oligoflexia bacterium]